jgi:uncharacterized protein YecE (DUF72 family)
MPHNANPTMVSPASEKVFIGTSGWAYSTWKPRFYPQSIPQKKFLDYYATQLNSVEVNYTFRALPTASMLAGWLGATGSGFRISFKAPQRITHILRLKDCAESVAALARALAPVANAGKMGIVLFQLPPNFKADPSRLATFLADATPSGLKLAFEFRHQSWFGDQVFELLRHHNAALCVAESEDLETPDIKTATFACYRLRKNEYSPEQLRALASKLGEQSAKGDVYAYFKHEDEPKGALCAVETLQLLRR